MKSPWQIAHILPWPNVGGTEHATLRVARATEGREFHNRMFCRAGAQPVADFFASAGFEVIQFDAQPFSFRHPSAFLRASRALAGDLTRNQIDLVHCSDVFAANFAAVGAKWGAGRVLCHVRNRIDVVPFRDRPTLFPVDRFAFVSADTWSRFGYSVRPQRGSVLYDGLALPDLPGTQAIAEVRRELGVGDSTRLIGMAARVAPQKDYRTLIRAAAEVVDACPDVRFVVIGDNSRQPLHVEHFKLVKDWLGEEKMEPFFTFTGYRDDVARLLPALDIFVLSTHFEGLPLVVLEAMAFGLPVVATAVDGIPEIVEHASNGFLFAHENAGQLAGQLIELLNNPTRSAEFGAAARESVRTRFSQEQFAVNLRTLYRDLLDS